jgi:TatD DNase family protein
MHLIDSHCHVYLPEFGQDLPGIIERAEAEGVTALYLPAIDSETTKPMLELEVRYPGKCFPMMGLHPCSVKENYEEELRMVSDWLAKRKFVAVGEIGLDFYWDKTFTGQQYDAFKRQVNLAKQYRLPIVIHSRESIQECIDVVKELKDERLSGIFHCFSGNIEQAQQIIELGFYMGIGGVLTYKNSGLAPVVEQIPLEYLVLETDAPYLTPVPFRGKRNEPGYLKYIVQKLADVKYIDPEEVARITSSNTQKIFGA